MKIFSHDEMLCDTKLRNVQITKKPAIAGRCRIVILPLSQSTALKVVSTMFFALADLTTMGSFRLLKKTCHKRVW